MGASLQKFMVIVLGLCLIVPFAYKLCTYGLFRYQSIGVDGVVVKSLSGSDMGGRAILEYKDLDGNPHEIVSQYKTHWFFAPRLGERIRVFFLAYDPEVAIVDSLFHYIIFPLFLTVVGIALVYSVGKRNPRC